MEMCFQYIFRVVIIAEISWIAVSYFTLLLTVLESSPASFMCIEKTLLWHDFEVFVTWLHLENSTFPLAVWELLSKNGSLLLGTCVYIYVCMYVYRGGRGVSEDESKTGTGKEATTKPHTHLVCFVTHTNS
jgi:hypothetical protein